MHCLSVQAAGVFVDISPGAFVDLTLPVYKPMMSHIPTLATIASGPIAMSNSRDMRRAFSTPNQYTPASFGRLLALASRRLRLGTAHFEEALHATVRRSGLILASNLAQEQVSFTISNDLFCVVLCDRLSEVELTSWDDPESSQLSTCRLLQAALFQAFNLPPIRQSYAGDTSSPPLDSRRVVLLVPQSGISLLRAFVAPEAFLSLADKRRVFDNHFVSIHMAYVRVRRGTSDLSDEDRVDG